MNQSSRPTAPKPLREKQIERRNFLSRLPGSFVAAAAYPLTAEEPLHVLNGTDFRRLRLDFNASRSKVRILLLLSPT